MRESAQTRKMMERAAVVALIAMAPVVWDPWGVQAFLHPKLLVLGIGLLVGGLALAAGSIDLPGSRAIRWALAVFCVAAIVSIISADAPWVALLGSAPRQLGLTVWIGHVLIALVGFNLFREEPSSGLSVIGVSLLSGLAVVSVFALLEGLGLSPFDFNQTFGGRVQSVLGNPAALGAYCVLGLPVAAAITAEASLSTRRRVVAAIVVLSSLLALILTGSRGAWMGAGVAAVAVVILSTLRRKTSNRFRVAAGLAVVLVIVATLPSGRWQTLGEAGEGRAALWAVGLEAAIANPVVGAGPEGFAFEFGEHVDESFVVEYTREQVYDRAHNGVIDAAVAFGIPGLGAYLVLMGGVLVCIYRGLRSEDWTIIGIAAGLLAYLVQQQTYFQVAVVDAVFWLMAGLLAGRVATLERNTLVGSALRPAAIALGCWLAVYAVLGIAADHYDKRALATRDAYVAIDALETAASLRPVDNVHYLQAAAIGRQVPDASVVQRTLDLIRGGRKWSPTDELLILAEVNLLNQSFRLSGDYGALADGDSLLLELLARDPTNGEAYLRLGTSAYYRGDVTAAEDYWLRAATLLPNSNAPRSNLEILYSEFGE